MSRILSPKETAALLGLSTRSLERLRLRGDGPPFFRAGERLIRYSEDTVRSWMKEREAASIAEERARHKSAA